MDKSEQRKIEICKILTEEVTEEFKRELTGDIVEMLHRKLKKKLNEAEPTSSEERNKIEIEAERIMGEIRDARRSSEGNRVFLKYLELKLSLDS